MVAGGLVAGKENRTKKLGNLTSSEQQRSTWERGGDSSMTDLSSVVCRRSEERAQLSPLGGGSSGGDPFGPRQRRAVEGRGE